ncbi:MAG: hypothetical protein MUF71_21850 [Candidatus Kapabacteria bacterium]|jgi:hypothetical protein|nr:hypothetical protein [Candidatus Kapabacteria bacterium]
MRKQNLLAAATFLALWLSGTVLSGTRLFCQQPSAISAEDTLQTYYICAAGSLITNARFVGLANSPADARPLPSVGLSFTTIGNKLFKNRNVRLSSCFEKLIDDYPSAINLRLQVVLGYNIVKTSDVMLYPFVSAGLQTQIIDERQSVLSLPFQAGLGGDVLFPQTPLMLGVQCGYTFLAPIGYIVDKKTVDTYEFLPGSSGFGVRLYLGYRWFTE